VIEISPAHKNRMLDLEVDCARFSIRIRGSNGYVGRDPQGGTSDGSVCKLSLKIIFFYYLQ